MLTLCTKDHIFKCTRADLHAFRSIWTALLWQCSVCTFVSAIVNQPSVENLLLGVLPNTSSQRTEREQCGQLLFSHIITQQMLLLFRGKAAKGYSVRSFPILQLKKKEKGVIFANPLNTLHIGDGFLEHLNQVSLNQTDLLKEIAQGECCLPGVGRNCEEQSDATEMGSSGDKEEDNGVSWGNFMLLK